MRRSLEEKLENEPCPKLIKVMTKVVTQSEVVNKKFSQDLEFIITECSKSPNLAKEVAEFIKSKSEVPDVPKSTGFTPEEALSIVIDKKFTVDDYCSIQQDLKARDCHAFPPYYKVQNAKKLCYPEEDICATEREASISLHSLLLHTFRRIIKSLDINVNEYCKQKQQDTHYCTMEGSWGFDGSSGQSLYKQRFSDGDDHEDNSLFATTYIPLRLKSDDGFTLWTNPNPQSFRFCRPLKIQYRPENKDLCLN